MKLTILGSGTVIPFPGRGNSGYILQTNRHMILIDGGSGALRRIVDYRIDYKKIDTICYTHLHPDHTFDFIPLLFALKHDPLVDYPRSLEIIAPFGFKSYFNRLMDIYHEWVRPEKLKITIKEVRKGSITVDQLTIKYNPTHHADQSITYRFIDSDGKDIFYSGDTDFCEELIESAYNVEILILECSFPDNLKRKGHLTPSECGKIAKATNCGRLILTHFYPEVLKTDIQTSISKFFPGPVDLAYDGMEVIIGD